MIKLYTIKNCKYCEEAKKYLDSRNESYTVIDLSAKENKEYRKYYRSLGVTVAPIITGFNYEDGEWIVCGFQEEEKKKLEKLIKNG